jgi:hypothetical protein
VEHHRLLAPAHQSFCRLALRRQRYERAPHALGAQQDAQSTSANSRRRVTNTAKSKDGR